MDGDDAEWVDLPATTIGDAASAVGRVSLAYDRDALYVRWRVADESPMRNRLQDPPNHFKEGDALDLMLGPWREAAGPLPVDGDLRLLVVPQADAPPVWLYRQVDSRAAPGEAATFWSPVRAVRFDAVTERADVQAACAQTEEGYVCEARIPWTVLRFEPRPGARLRGDVGVLSSNDGGIMTDRRQYRFNTLATTVSDLPTEAELTPGGWGCLKFER